MKSKDVKRDYALPRLVPYRCPAEPMRYRIFNPRNVARGHYSDSARIIVDGNGGE